MDKWFKYLKEARASVPRWGETVPDTRSNGSRSSAAGIKKSIKSLTDTGGNTGGNPDGYERMDDPLQGKKKKKDISAPPGAPGGGIGPALEEEVESESFDKNTTLEPHFWENDVLKKKIAKRLRRIADDFFEGLEVPAEMLDLRFTGSLANYNWSRYSDVDLHLVVDYSKIDLNAELVKAFFDASRMRWNELHDIRIYGYEVEIYVEDIDDVHRSSGVYSISRNEWLKEPDPSDVHFDFSVARAKSEDIITQVNMIEKFIKKKPRSALASIERLKHKIRSMRRAGLMSNQQEFSAENIAFKILRREEILQKLNDMKYHSYDEIMSMELS